MPEWKNYLIMDGGQEIVERQIYPEGWFGSHQERLQITVNVVWMDPPGWEGKVIFTIPPRGACVDWDSVTIEIKGWIGARVLADPELLHQCRLLAADMVVERELSLTDAGEGAGR